MENAGEKWNIIHSHAPEPWILALEKDLERPIAHYGEAAWRFWGLWK